MLDTPVVMGKREWRNVAIATVAQVQGKEIRFTYTNRNGETRRRNVKPIGFRPTRLGVIMVAEDDGGPKNFRLDRIFRATMKD